MTPAQCYADQIVNIIFFLLYLFCIIFRLNSLIGCFLVSIKENFLIRYFYFSFFFYNSKYLLIYIYLNIYIKRVEMINNFLPFFSIYLDLSTFYISEWNRGERERVSEIMNETVNFIIYFCFISLTIHNKFSLFFLPCQYKFHFISLLFYFKKIKITKKQKNIYLKSKKTRYYYYYFNIKIKQ